jgi:AcrR family transcriptional regulator
MACALPTAGSVADARRAEIAAVARRLLDSEGPRALSMRRIAAELGMQAPSLYEHVGSKAQLEADVIASGLAEWSSALATAGRDLAAVAASYRAFAVANPALYELMTGRPLPRDLLPLGLEAGAAKPLIELLGDEDAARAVWAAAHGLVSLELAGRFPPGADLDAAWAAMVRAFGGAQAQR